MATPILYRVRRYNPDENRAFIQEFEIPVESGMTVLDGLHYIKQKLDATLAMRYSCRMGVCGSCAMLINGRPSLACNNQILDVAKKVLDIAPLPNFPVIKDLVPDLRPLFEKHAALSPFILRQDEAEQNAPTGEFFQSPEELTQYLQFTYCIKCGACMAACPTMATDPDYPGPMPLAQAHRYSADSRDAGFPVRRDAVATPHGAYRCHYAGECSNVCPKGVDPARAVQLLKRRLVLDYLNLDPKRTPAPVIPKAKAAAPKENA